MVIKRLQKGNKEALLIDGIIPCKDGLKSMLSINKIRQINNKDLMFQFFSKRNSMNNQDNDTVFCQLFSLFFNNSMSSYDNCDINAYYLIPPFKKPNYKIIRSKLSNGEYDITSCELLGYGPCTIYPTNTHRKVRYRIILMHYNNNESDNIGKILENSIDSTRFQITKTRGKYPIEIERIYESESDYFINKTLEYRMSSSDRDKVQFEKILKSAGFIVMPLCQV